MKKEETAKERYYEQYTVVDMAKKAYSILKSANLEGLGTTFPKTEAIITMLRRKQSLKRFDS